MKNLADRMRDAERACEDLVHERDEACAALRAVLRCHSIEAARREAGIALGLVSPRETACGSAER